MKPFFLVLVLMVAASMLIAVAAVVRTIWLRVRPGRATPDAGHSPIYSRTSDLVLILAVAMSWYGVAAGWAGQLVCYPIYADMSGYGAQAFHAYSNGYLSRWATGTWPVGLMCLTWAVLLWVPIRNVPKGLVSCIVALCLAFAVVTPPAAIAQSHMFSEGFSQEQYDRLMLWNGFRTAIFTLIGLLALVVMQRRLLSSESPSAEQIVGREPR